MKNIYSLLLAMLITTLSLAQAPQTMSYQAVVRDAEGKLVIEQEVGMKISILKGTADGIEVYTETQTPSTNKNGLVSIEIGGEAGFADIDWSDGPYFLKTDTDPSGETDYVITGISQLLSVPYSLHARIAETADYNALINLPNLFDGDYNSLTSKPQTISDFELNADSRNIINLANPLNEQDAARKAYVDLLADALLTRIEALEDASEIEHRDITYGDGVIDYDGNIYQTIIVGQREWMAENLRVTHYNNGVAITTGLDGNDWENTTGGAYAIYSDDDEMTEIYGLLYNWYAVETGNLCPDGWHVPNDDEWTELINNAGWENTAGSRLKSDKIWYDGEPGTDDYGFSALPGGARNSNGSFGNVRGKGNWWSSTESSGTNAYSREMAFNNNGVIRAETSKQYGFSIRCVADPEGILPNIITFWIQSADITEDSATGGGNITDDGGLEITARGVVWSRLQNPTLENNEGSTSDGDGVGEFTSTITGLEPGTRYNVRAYATNSLGTAYGFSRQIITPGQPAVSDVRAYNITNTSFSLSGGINDDGGQLVISKGFVWSKTQVPTLDENDGLSDEGEGASSFTRDVGGLEPGTTYHIRAYATNSDGTRYGNQLSVQLKSEAYFSAESADELNEEFYRIAGGGSLWDVSWGASLHNWTYGSVASDDAYKGSELTDQIPVNEIERWEVAVTNNYPAEKWRLTLEMGVKGVNELLFVLEESNEIYDNIKDRLMAEARFFRGFFNFEAWLVFKNIPIYLEDRSDPALVSNDNPGGAVLEHIIADLQYAWENLPEDQSEPKRPTKYAAMALAAKAYLQVLDYASAKPLLDNIINSGRYELMPNFLDNYRIAHNNNSESIFEIQTIVNDINESLNAEMGIGLNYPHGADIGMCCGFHQPSQNLVNAYRVDVNGLPMFDTFNDNDLKNDMGIASSSTFIPFEDEVDPRLDWTVSRRGIPYRDWGINRGRDWVRYQPDGGPYLPASKPFFNKSERYTHSTTTGWMSGVNDNNFRYLRYTHILLWRAEVAAYEGDLAMARELVNLIRTRAGIEVVMGKVLIDELPSPVYPWGEGTSDNDYLTGGDVDWTQPAANYDVQPYPEFSDQAEAMRAVQWELRLEFATEGLRFFDLRRWGNLPAGLNSMPMIETLNSFAEGDQRIRTFMNGASFTERDKYQPIPQMYIDANPGLVQNPGY